MPPAFKIRKECPISSKCQNQLKFLKDAVYRVTISVQAWVTEELSVKMAKSSILNFWRGSWLRFWVICLYQHWAIIRTGITCKKIPCYVRDSDCRWFIVKKAKIFWSYVKYFQILAGVRKCRILIGLCK